LRLILDANIVLWSLQKNPLLPRAVARLIGEQTEVIGFSVAQFWEVEIKIAAGRIPAFVDFSDAVETLGLQLVPIEPADTIRAAALPPHHGDPFDRLLIAQALARDLTIVTHDRAFEPYAVPVVWA
jgi:PIN domain nuclease of toxin-antitoxin system